MTIQVNGTAIACEQLQQRLAEKVSEVARQPEHNWGDGFCAFMTEPDGRPVVRLAAVHCPPDTDIWQGLRSPAQVGMYPVGLEDIWTHYATSSIRSTRPDGSPNPLAMPEPFADAADRFGRAVIVSAMLAMNGDVFEAYAEKIDRGDLDPPDAYGRARGEIATILDKAVGKLALSLIDPSRAVIPMTPANAGKVIDGTRSNYTKGRYHGPCNNHYPQNSIAVMTGLLKFGISRLPFRDEIGPDGRVRRLLGVYASIVIFDGQPPVADDAGGVTLLDADRLAWLKRVNDYTDVAGVALADRYCTYNLTAPDSASVCGKCIYACPAEALAHSSPDPAGNIPESILRQKHRFSGGALDFDAGNCGRDRGQKAQIYADYVCARCEAVCAARGIRKPAADVAAINVKPVARTP